MTGPQTSTVATAQYQTTSAASPESRTPAVVIAVAASAVSSRRFGPPIPSRKPAIDVVTKCRRLSRSSTACVRSLEPSVSTGGSRRSRSATAIRRSASSSSSIASTVEWVRLLAPVTTTPTMTKSEQVNTWPTTKPVPNPSVFSRPACITAIVAANASALKPASSA